MSRADAVAKEKAQEKDQVEGYRDPPMTLWDHLAELRKRLLIAVIALLVCAAASWELRIPLFELLVQPFVEAWKIANIPGEPTLHFQTPAAAFLAYFKLSLLAGTAFAAPVIFYQVWAFIAPGLYAREKRFVIPFVVCSSALFSAGGYFGWRLAFPMAFQYLLGMSGDVGPMKVVPTVMMGDYIDFTTRMLLAFGMVFEIPLFIFFLSVAGIVNYLHLIRYGRWFVVAAFVAAAIITPPDVTSQVLIALPMIVLYVVSIGLARIFGKPPTEAQREAYKRSKEKKPEPEKKKR